MYKKVSFFDIGIVHGKIITELKKGIENVLINGDFIQGEAVQLFEDNLKLYQNSNFCVSCANGSDALTIAIRSLELIPQSEIIVPSFNYISSAESIALLGFKPVFCDVSLKDGNTRLNFIQEKITKDTSCVIVTHLFGRMVEDIEEIKLFLESKNIKLIEDNAQSFGTQHEGKSSGNFGQISTTSFFPTKNLGALGDGGALFTTDEKLATKIKSLCQHGQSKKYFYDELGYNSRLDTLQAIFLDEKLKHIDDHLSERKSNAELYFELLKELKSISLPPRTMHSFNQFSIRVRNGKRDHLKEILAKEGVQTMIYYPLGLHQQKVFEKLQQTTLANTEQYCQEVLSLPIYPGLKTDDIHYLCKIILENCE